jgi:Ca2+-binding RTX toxin-like protein
MSFEDYRRNHQEIINAMIAVVDGWQIIGRGITAGKAGVFVYGKARDYTDGASRALDITDLALSGLNFFSPIKAPVEALQAYLKVGEQPIRRLDKQLALGEKKTITTASNETLRAIDTIKDGLQIAGLTHAVANDVLVTFTGLNILVLLVSSEVADAIEAAEREEGSSSASVSLSSLTTSNAQQPSDWQALIDTLDAEAAPRVEAMALVAPKVETVQAKIDDFIALFEVIDFSAITTDLAGLEQIGELLEKLKVPLDIAFDALDPIKPLLDAIGLISGVMDSVVDFVVETLGLGDLLDEAGEALLDLLPSGFLFDELLEQLQPLYDILQEMIDEALGVTALLNELEQAIFGDGFGDALQSALGFADNDDNVLRGDDEDDVLAALAGDDEIYGGGGNDIIIAGEGNDELYGGAGNDFFHFNASFTEYELSREKLASDTEQGGEANGDIIVSHLRPLSDFNSGVDVLRDLDAGDVVAFSDISFTGQELKEAFIGGSVLTGSARNDLMFLNSTGTRIDGFYVAEGLAGDDRIFGSTEDDRLFGGDGNDVLLPGQGNDEAFGGSGSDTFQILSGANRSLRIDLEAGTAFGQGSDTLVDIENVIAMPGQKHFVRGTDDPNVIVTAGGIDVVSGRGGDDYLRTGGEDDYVIGGAGSDIIEAGTGFNVMLSGSAAVSGVSDTYIGGVGFDVVAYTSESNTIRFDVNDQSGDSSILQQVKNYLNESDDSGRVEIDGTTGLVKRFDAQGTHVATDVTRDVEGFVGSDLDDVLVGGAIATFLHGGGGNDIIRTNGTENIDGGDGDDIIFAERVPGGSTQLQIEGGSGFDRLELDGVGEARWYYKLESSIALQLRAHDLATEGDDLRNASGATFSIKPRNIEEIKLGDYDDHAIYEPGGSNTTTFELGGGDDRFDGENGFAVVFADVGNDVGNFYSGGGGIFHGGAGDDSSIWSDTTRENAALMGDGTDTVEIRRFFGHADGGDGYDSISFEVAFNSRIVADLGLGTVESFKGVSTNNADQVGMTLEGFEQFIATDFSDFVTGSDRGERLIGRDGNDALDGDGGNDEIFGGLGTDTLLGGAGDDVLHGGLGQDILDGGEGRDTASYKWVEPDGIDGAFIASVFEGVTVDLSVGLATGAFGTDILGRIENVVGSAGDDTLIGDGEANLLSGGDGDDTLNGAGGDDVLITGAGMDTVDGGTGDDQIVVGLGVKVITGGEGVDTLDFGLIDGVVTVDYENGTYSALVETEVPRWFELDLDGDDVAESDGFEARSIGGVMMTPEDVLATDALFADDAADLTRVLPLEGEAGFAAARVESFVAVVEASGTFTGIEQIVGALSDDRMLGSREADDFAGGESADVLIGRDGSDRLTGDSGDDLLIGEDVTDASKGSKGQVFRIFQATLDRLPDTTGFDAWSERLGTYEQSLLQVISGFTNSPEFRATYGALDDLQFVNLLYQNVLGRAGEAAGVANWVGALDGGASRAQVVLGFSESREFKNKSNDTASAYAEARGQNEFIDDVFRIYQASLDRAPDVNGLDRWSEDLANGRFIQDVARAFVNSTEFQQEYGALDNVEFVTLLYNNVLNRAPDSGGLARWIGELRAGEGREDVLVGFSQSAEFVRNTTPDVLAYMRALPGDVFKGGAGDDILAGGDLADLFIFDAADTGHDRVLQLDPWDSLQFTGFGYTTTADAIAKMQARGPDVVFDDAGVTATFADQTLLEIQALQFVI